jgi:hypothetical protein
MDLLSVGAPLLLTGFGSVLLTVDRFVVLKYFDATTMGYYALAATFVVYINDLSNLLSRVVFPRMVMRLGENESVERLEHFVHLPITAASYAFPVFVIWIHYFCVWGFRLVYPKYEPGAGVMEVLTFSILPYSHFLSHEPRSRQELHDALDVCRRHSHHGHHRHIAVRLKRASKASQPAPSSACLSFLSCCTSTRAKTAR